MSGLLGVNVPTTGMADLDLLTQSKAAWARLVLLPDAGDRLRYYRNAGLKVLGVLARESMEACPDRPGWLRWYAERFAPLVDALQVGNEPDHTSPSSWTMSLTNLTQLGAVARGEFHRYVPSLPIVMGGLASGNPGYLDTEVSWPAVFGICAIHPYTQTITSIGSFVQSYRNHARGKPLWATEFAWYDGIARPLADLLPVSMMYCWQRWAGWQDALVDEQGAPTVRYAQFRALAHEVNRVATTSERLEQLEKQQSLQTDALKAIGQLLWKPGVESLEGTLRTLTGDPNLEVADFPPP